MDMKDIDQNKIQYNKHLNHTGSGHPAIIMSKRYTGSICLTDIPKEKIILGKNGKKYLNVTLWLNDTEDQYKNIGSIQVQQSKEERESGGKGLYIGNFKEPAAAAVENKAVVLEDFDSGLPF